jgi:hypothetical protein
MALWKFLFDFKAFVKPHRIFDWNFIAMEKSWFAGEGGGGS